jgi:CHAT domain-containing protein
MNVLFTDGAKMFEKTRKWLSLLICSCLVMMALPAWAQLEEVGQLKISAQETQRLQELVNKPVDPGALNTSKEALLKEKSNAARLLGDTVNEEKFLREALPFATDSWAKASLRELKWIQGDRAEAYRLGEELVKEVSWLPLRVNSQIELSYYYMQDQNLKRAAELIAQAGSIIRNEFGNLPRRGLAPFTIARAEMIYFAGKSELESRSGQWTQAIESSKLAVAKSKDMSRMLNWTSDIQIKERGQEYLLIVQAMHAKRQMDAGLASDAEWTLREVFKTAKSYGFSEARMVRFFMMLAEHYNTAGQFKDALQFSQKIEALLDAQNLDQESHFRLNAQQKIHEAMAGMDDWAQLVKRLDASEAARQKAGRVDKQAALRGWAYLKAQRYAEAAKLLDAELQSHVASFGESHFYTALTRGLLAQALSMNGQKEQSRAAFDKASQNLTAPESLSGDFAENAIQRKMKRFILQSYMQLLSTTAANNAQDAQILFSVADQISTSTVQQALTEAAVRAGVNVPGLSDIIRKEQDARNEITTLSTYIANQNSEAPEKRNPQVVAQMRERKQVLEAQRKEYKAQIQKQYPEYFQLIQPKPASHTDIAKQLKPDELFVSILPMDDQTYVWAVDAQGGVNFHRSPLTESDAQTLVTRIRKTLDVAGLGNKAPAFAFADSHKLYKELLGPLESRLQGKTHLIVATSGALAQMPMAVLTRSPSDASWLIKDVAISHVPTANGWLSLKKLGEQPSSPQALLAWGDPAFDPKATQVAAAPATSVVRSAVALRSVESTSRNVMDAETYVNYSKIPPLPETRDEVLELAKIMDANPAQDVILGKDATRQSVLKSSASGVLGKKQVVVFATHGLLAGDLPNLNQPALAMAGNSNPNESPLLTLEDVLSLKLNADWVVLSACNTAGADGKAEEALSGLARGFFFAGSRSLLVTHWSVESESAMQLTTHTFAAYKKNPTMRRADALRQAMLETMKSPQYAHPAYWAPYALVGEGGR